jgi:anti-sigma regulatory factor (Ser/Thr protein kinase)
MSEEERNQRMGAFVRAQHIYRSDEIAGTRVDLALVDDLVSQGVVDGRARKQIELAFQEALSNSLEHGNLELDSAWREETDSRGVDRYSLTRAERLRDPRFGARKVTVVVECGAEFLEIRIGDEGPGFVPKPRKFSPGDTQCSGRGLALIEECLDEVRYERGGREVVMRKKLRKDQNGAQV